ncbi:MAG: SpoIIE family protein phosphatase [Epsilonproteobacteria bacterium]|nr:SpoIIE family protein phosphatase [Campylobacterota bacterium]
MKSITTRFSLATVFVSVLVLLSIIAINYIYIKDQLTLTANNKAKLEIFKSQSKINKILFQAITSSNSAKNSLQRKGLKQDNITLTLTKKLENNSNLYGMAVAMEPGIIYKKPFSPYYYKKGKHIIYVNLATNKYNYLSQSWYANIKKSRIAKWSEPYFDKGGGEVLMATYSNPIFYNDKFAGVVTIDLSLEKLKDIVSSMHILDTGYAFLLSKNHTILVYPKKSVLMKQYTDKKISFDKIIKENNRWLYYAKIESTGWILGIVLPKNELFSSLYKITTLSILLALFGIFILIITIFIVSSKITNPLKRVIEKTVEIANGNFDKHIEEPKTKDEIYQLSTSINKMQDKIKNYIENLKIATKKEEKINSELSIARKIQMDMLPIAKECKDEDNIKLYASLKPAKEVGGDFYDFIELGDDKLCFVVADVSGKGVPAALFMAVTISYIRAFSSKGLMPSKIVEKVNNALCVNNEASMFVTLFLGIIDLKSSEMLYVNAGHPKPYLFSSTLKATQIGAKNDPIIGAMEDIKYRDLKLNLKNGEKLFLYTDGVNEAFSKNGEQFGERRIQEQLDGFGHDDAKFVLTKMSKSISSFCVGEQQSDDITMLLVEVKKGAL